MDNITNIVRKVENDIANKQVREDMEREASAGALLAAEKAAVEIANLMGYSGKLIVRQIAAVIYKHNRLEREL